MHHINELIAKMYLSEILLLMKISSDFLMWIIGALIIVAAGLILLWQRREQKHLQEELNLLETMNKQNVEYDLVLKAMKLATWKLDVLSYTVTFDSDYRDSNSYSPASGTDVDDVFNHLVPEDAERTQHSLQQLIEGAIDEIHEEYRMKLPHSDIVYWGETYAMIGKRDDDGQPLEIIGTSRRIDEQKRIEEELTSARNKAEESDRLKSAFLANMSHEIRTPLNAIVGFSDILPMVENKEERVQLISLIQENNHKLLRMINDIVNISKLEAGAQPLHKDVFDLNMLLKEKAEQFRSTNTNADIDIIALVSEKPKQIVSDRTRISEVLEQYMLNAIKFTEKGSITLGYDQMPGDYTRIWVRDTGKGIPTDKQDKIFNHFVKLDEFIPGTGLGLPICRSIAKSMDAHIGVDSQEGSGSTFWIELKNK